MKRTLSIALKTGFVAAGVTALYLSRPVIVVTESTPLWDSEYDASRQGTNSPGTGTPLTHMKVGERLRVILETDDKDHRAYLVLGPHWQKGWVLYGQRGIKPPA
jgi:hypothetical protein